MSGDANRLAQVIGNLLSNAIKYSPDGGVVEVVGEQDGDITRLSVTDEGVGIPAEQQAQIFTKFFRGDAAASGIAGSGLGLAFARAVVEHGGRMSFTSTVGEVDVQVERGPSWPGRGVETSVAKDTHAPRG